MGDKEGTIKLTEEDIAFRNLAGAYMKLYEQAMGIDPWNISPEALGAELRSLAKKDKELETEEETKS